jgi:hypothetical protein
MKKALMSLLIGTAIAGTSFAGAPVMGKEYKQPVPEPTCFKDTELQLDVFGSYNETRYGGYEDGYGGGLGVNYYFMRYVGIGVDGNIYDGGASGVWNVSSSLLLRLPLDSCCLAFYALGGGGIQMDGTTAGTWHVGGGLEYRVVPEKIGIFGEGRYIWSADSAGDTAQARLGVRVVF